MKNCKNADGSKPCEEPHCFCPPPRGTSQSGQTDAAPRASGAKTVSREVTPAVAAPFADTLAVMSGRVPSAARSATPAENMEVLYARLHEHMSPAEQRELQEVIGILKSAPSSEAVATDKPRWADQYDFDKSDPATRLFVAASNWMDRAERAEEELQRVKVERGEIALKLAGAKCFIEEQRKKGNIT